MCGDRLVLVAEDDEVTRTLLSVLLSREGYRVSTTDSLLGAKALIESETPALLLTDWQLGEDDGLVLGAWCRSEGHTFPMLLMSTERRRSLYEEAVAAGFRGVLVKPLEPERLWMEVDRLLRLEDEQHRFARETLEGVVQLLAALLEASHAPAFSHTQALQKLAMRLADALRFGDRETLSLAAPLSQLGLLFIPQDVLARALQEQPLTREQETMLQRHARAAQRILQHLPGLERVAHMIGHQAPEQRRPERWTALDQDADILQGACLLRLADWVCRQQRRAIPDAQILRQLREAPPPEVQRGLAPEILDALEEILYRPEEASLCALPAAALVPGMILQRDACTPAGQVLLPRGTPLNLVHIERLRRFAESRRLVEPLSVASLSETASSLPQSASA